MQSSTLTLQKSPPTPRYGLTPFCRNERPTLPTLPSCSVFTTMTSYDETRQALERLADHGTPLAVKDFVTTHVAQWKRNTSTPHQEAIHNLVQGFLMSAVSEVNWTTVYETLQG